MRLWLGVADGLQGLAALWLERFRIGPISKISVDGLMDYPD